MVNVVQAQPEKYDMNFDMTLSNLGQMVTKKGYAMQFTCTAETGSQPVKPKVGSYTWKIECKKYPKADWNSMSRKKKIRVRKLCEQQCIKPATKKTSVVARVAALEAQLVIHFQHKEGDVKKKRGRGC